MAGRITNFRMPCTTSRPTTYDTFTPPRNKQTSRLTAFQVEFERLDIIHHLIYLVALNKQLHLATFRTAPRRILDVGFGTGFWMSDMEKQYPHAELIGIDLDASMGSVGNSRCIFKNPVDFTAPTWPVDNSSVDLVHMAQLCGCVPNWLDHYSKAYR